MGEGGCERGSESVCVCERERERGMQTAMGNAVWSERACVCVKREGEFMCVCVCAREGGNERVPYNSCMHRE